MKSATVFLMAVSVVTLFLECTTAPNPPASQLSNTKEDFIEIEDCFKEFVHNSIETCLDNLAKAQKVITEALSSYTGDDKEALLEADNWLNEYLEPVLSEIPDALIDAVDTGSVSALKQVNSDMYVEIDRTTADLDNFKEILHEGEAKDGFVDAIETILDKATTVGEAIDNLLDGYNIIC